MVGGVVTFAGPETGAGVAGGAVAVTIDDSGVATLSSVADGTAGSYTVTASTGAATPATFGLTNTTPALSVAVAGPAAATVGNPFTYTITASNAAGTAAADGVQVTFALPPGVTFAFGGANAPPGFTSSYLNRVVTFVGTLAAGSSVTFGVTVTPTAAGPLMAPAGAAVIDPGFAIPESDESGNTSAQAVTTAVSTATATAVVLAPGSAPVGQPVAVTATVTGGDIGVAVAFYLDGSATPFATGIVGANGQATATLPTTGLVAGDHTVTATYAGDSTTLTSSGSAKLTIVLAGTTVTLAGPSGAVMVGGAVTLTATVTPSQGSGTPTGTVVFSVDGSPVSPPVTVSDGAATFASTGLAVGPHTVTATYSGDKMFAGGAAGPVTVTVDPVVTVTPTALAPATVGTPYTVTLTASGPVGPFTYTVTAGALPAGLTLSPAGVLSGTPDTAGSVAFTLTATNAASESGAGRTFSPSAKPWCRRPVRPRRLKRPRPCWSAVRLTALRMCTLRMRRGNTHSPSLYSHSGRSRQTCGRQSGM